MSTENSITTAATAAATTAAAAAQPARTKRKDLVGEVTGRSGDKTIKVTYSYKIPHPQYGKEIKRKTVLHVHDEKNECGVGDKVEIVSTRPLSKLKRWRVARIVSKAKIVGIAA